MTTRTRIILFVGLTVLVLAVAAGITVAVMQARAEARVRERLREFATEDLTQMEVALDSFDIDADRFPTQAEGLPALVRQPHVTDFRWRGPYLKRVEVPADPWGRPWVYRNPGTHNPTGYDLFSMGEDGKEGGGDDIGNW